MMLSKWFKPVFKGGAVLAALVALVWLPLVHLVVVAVNLLVSLFVLGMQAISVRLPRITPERRSLGGQRPFISIHVPAHNEPPELLKETLRSLSELEWDNYEVLVIDNNTTDRSLWEPVAEYCQELGPKFRFFHVENMKGFKAGAMNYLRQFMDARTEFVFVVDADYVVHPDAIKKGLSYFTEEKVGMVQFPQDYRNICAGNRGITLDFKHFFSAYMNMANRLECVPSTGTLSFLRLAALNEVKGFGTDVITEDADLGLRLALKGFRAVYAHETIGSGVMPHDLSSLKKQRWRWAFGNAQILKLTGRTLLGTPHLKWKQKLGFLTHLTAWFNFNLVPTLSFMLMLPLLFTGNLSEYHPYIVTMSGLTLVVWLLLRFSVFYHGLRRDGHSLKEIVQGFATHTGLGWVYSSSWIKCLWDHRAAFVRTNKFLTQKVPDAIRTTFTETALGIGLFVAFVEFALEGFLIAPIAALLIGLTRFAIHWVESQMRRTLALSVEEHSGATPPDASVTGGIYPVESTTTG
ncbi:MAG TPA: glycosyltransferase family 2 protein [Verrucomicrobiae bacterium]